MEKIKLFIYELIEDEGSVLTLNFKGGLLNEKGFF